MNWRLRAACKGKGVDPWFAGRATIEGRRAVTLCLLCPVRDACLADCMNGEAGSNIRVGIRGGMGPAERAAYAKAVGA